MTALQALTEERELLQRELHALYIEISRLHEQKLAKLDALQRIENELRAEAARREP